MKLKFELLDKKFIDIYTTLIRVRVSFYFYFYLYFLATSIVTTSFLFSPSLASSYSLPALSTSCLVNFSSKRNTNIQETAKNPNKITLEIQGLFSLC